MSDLRAKCTKFDFRWGAYSAPQSPHPLAVLRGLLLRGGGKRGEGEGTDGKEDEEKGWNGRERREGQKCREREVKVGELYSLSLPFCPSLP